LQAQLAGASVDAAQQAQWAALQQQLATARQEAVAAQEDIARLHPRAPFDAVVLAVDEAARAGSVVSAQQPLLQLAAPGRWRVVAYAGESAARALRPGDAASFTADAAPARQLAAQVLSVAPHASTLLAEPVLAQAHGGALEAVAQGRDWLLTQPLYRVELELREDPALSPRQWRGHAVLAQPARSAWERLWTAAAAVAVREMGF
jgi:putative peptide zinc metalloprotease protein